MTINSRRQFLVSAGSGLVLVSGPAGASAQVTSQQPIPKRPDPLRPAMVQEFVRKAHADLPATKLTAWPGLLQSKGPHGISLLRHARAGGDEAKPVEEYLLRLGAA